MATRNVDIGTDPINLITTHSLAVGTRYAFANVDSNARIFVREAAVKPTGGALRGFVLPPGVAGTVKPSTGIGVWVWTDRPDGCSAVIGEAA